MHRSLVASSWSFSAFVLGVVAILISAALGQSTGGRILGKVADQTASVVAGARVTLVNEATGATRDARTNTNGDYFFVEVPPGSYRVEFEQAGFKKNIQRGVLLELNQVVTLNSTLQLGTQKETVEVTGQAPLVDTTTTQLGTIVNNRSVNELPLNARDSYQFLQLQPGVQSQLGSSASTLYGADAAGSVSVNGGRGRSNNFSVNGGDANDQFVNAAAVQPSPDAIEEFRMITNTFDPEYGRNSGAVINVVTKSGTNDFHGNVYEYFRNKVLNAQGYFNTVNPQFNQNQFGGTFGGPVIKNRTFFFATYEGRRIRQGISGDVVTIPTREERGGDFSANGGIGGSISAGTITSPVVPFIPQVLDGRSGCDAALNEAYGIPSVAGLPIQTDPASGARFLPWSEVFPASVIPAPCQDPVAQDLLRFVPPANRPDGTFQGVPTKADDQNQFTARVDHRINDHQNLSVYYYFTDGRVAQPFYEFQGSGANVPGFGSLVRQRFQQWNLSHAWTLRNSLVNEARFTYMREGQLTFQHPQNTGAVTSFCTGAAANFCFNGTSDSSAINCLIAPSCVPPPYGAGGAGIYPGLPSNHTGLPFVNVAGGFNIGNGWEGELPQVGNSFQFSDSLSWVKGAHTMKFGADVRRSRFDQTYYYEVSGNFTFDSSGNNAVSYGDNYPGYLLGLADTYAQGSSQRENVRNTGVYLFAQDSWKIRPNLTLNYGLRWELDTPLIDILGHVQTFRPGETSKLYPCTDTPLAYCPTGLVVPGDPGVPAGMTSTYYKALAPRIGMSYSPNFDSGFLGKVFGSNGKTSIRAGWGLFYNPMEQLVLAQFGAEPPFGSSPSFYNTFFNTPFIAQDGTTAANGFNGVLTPPKGQDPGWSNYLPILLYGDFQPHLRTQYTAQYNFSFQRELAKNLLWQINYVGSQGHRLLASHDINAGNPQTCLDLINLGQGCGPTLEDNTYSFTLLSGNTLTLPSGQVVTGSPLPGSPTGTPIFLPGTRPYSAPNCVEYSTLTQTAGTNCPTTGNPVFTDIFAEDTIATSAYNSLQTMVEKRMSHGLQFQAAYTWSKSLDWASSFEETLNPFDFKKSRALSLFNSAQRFVINYVWDIPVPKYHGVAGKVLDDWQLSGITQFQSGFPIRLQTQNDNELIGSLFFFGTGAPQMTGNKPQILNPKTNGGLYLNPNQFADPTPGTFATTPRSICCGPGLNQWDVTLEKKVAITEAKYFEFRTDVFNVANKTMFDNPDGSFSDSTFGQIKHGRDPRLVQFALKFYF
jgi:outer membrane receptor protein involved in Fe transport